MNYMAKNQFRNKLLLSLSMSICLYMYYLPTVVPVGSVSRVEVDHVYFDTSLLYVIYSKVLKLLQHHCQT